MSWFVYEIAPIDFGWDMQSTVHATATAIATREVGERLSSSTSGGVSLDHFFAAWESAQDAAREEGWEGDFRGDPTVFWIPSDTEFDVGFVIKQDNNGTTYVVSPVELPHLDDLA